MPSHGSSRGPGARQRPTLFDRYLRRPLGDRQLHIITRANLAELHASVLVAVAERKRYHDRTRYTGLHSANHAVAMFVTLIQYAIDMERFRGPAIGLVLPPVQPRDRVLAPHEVPLLFDALGEASPKVRDIAMLVLYTGARPVNVMAMRWDELDLDTTPEPGGSQRRRTASPRSFTSRSRRSRSFAADRGR